jgi:hypothetical protein
MCLYQCLKNNIKLAASRKGVWVEWKVRRKRFSLHTLVFTLNFETANVLPILKNKSKLDAHYTVL